MNPSKQSFEDQFTVRLSREQLEDLLRRPGLHTSTEYIIRAALNTSPQTEERLREEIDRHEADLRDLAEQGE